MKYSYEKYQEEIEDRVMNSEDMFVPRSLSWLSFNYRVLALAYQRWDVPLYERAKFLSITESNLIEFFKVRFSVLLDKKNKSELITFRDSLSRFRAQQATVLETLLETNIPHIYEDMDDFLANRVSMDNLTCSVLYHMYFIDGSYVVSRSRVRHGSYVGSFKPYMDTYREFSDVEGEGLTKLENVIRLYKNTKVVFVEGTLDKEAVNYIQDRLDIDFMQYMDNDYVHIDYSWKNLSRLTGLIKRNNRTKRYRGFKKHNVFKNDKDILTRVLTKDYVIHHPYDTFDVIEKMLSQASNDDRVVGITQTIYRVSSVDAPLIKSLIRAKENGKNVTVIIEVKARFDEDQNNKLYSLLKDNGIDVVISPDIPEKVHSKIIHIDMVVGKSITHIGTGNYNDVTANMYTDIGLLTSSDTVGENIKNYISNLIEPGSVDDTEYRMSRMHIEREIYNEIVNCSNGYEGSIVIKVNQLTDKRTARILELAADKGVTINIICRGECILQPRENLVIKSIVGRFLEHARIYTFGNKGTPRVYISSGDLMERNLDRRYELFVPLESRRAMMKIVRILDSEIKDERNSHYAQKDRIHYSYDGGVVDVHLDLITQAISYSKKRYYKKY